MFHTAVGPRLPDNGRVAAPAARATPMLNEPINEGSVRHALPPVLIAPLMDCRRRNFDGEFKASSLARFCSSRALMPLKTASHPCGPRGRLVRRLAAGRPSGS